MNKRILSSYGGEIEPAIITAHMDNDNRREISKILNEVKIKREIDRIVVHCSATKEGQDFSAKDIDRWHRDRGFNKIGYHFVVKLNGEIEIGRGINEVGAHAAGYNSKSIGVCYVGGLDGRGKPADTRTEEQKDSMMWLMKKLIELPSRKPIILGHRDLPNVNKACPCFDAKEEYRYI